MGVMEREAEHHQGAELRAHMEGQNPSFREEKGGRE